MEYYSLIPSALGEILLASDGRSLTGLWFADQHSHEAMERRDALDIFVQTTGWLDRYFRGEAPDPREIPISMSGSTFAMGVWEILREIGYGETMTYGCIARRMAAKNPNGRMSAQAVGGAVGRNPISIIVPCHRVIGADGTVTGYTGGVERKLAMLEIEGIRL